MKSLGKRFVVSGISLVVCWRGYGNLSLRSTPIPRGLRPSVELRCYVWIIVHIRWSKQGIINRRLVRYVFHTRTVWSFTSRIIPPIWSKSSYRHGGNWSHRSVKGSGRWSKSPFLTSSVTLPSLYISRWWRQTWNTRLSITVINQSQAVRVGTEHGMGYMISLAKCRFSLLSG